MKNPVTPAAGAGDILNMLDGTRTFRLLVARQAREGALADKSLQLILDGLSRAVADPAGLPLFGAKSAPGLFAASAATKQAAQKCKDQGLLQVVRLENRGKSSQEICAITENGVAFLLAQLSPRHVLQELVHAVEARQKDVQALVATSQQLLDRLASVKTTTEQIMQHVRQPGAMHSCNGTADGADTWPASIMAYLAERKSASTMEDCPLPELHRRAQQTSPHLSIGQFHDGLRKLHQQEAIYLHPWTGPLYDLPEPALALLIGHEIAYYASRR